jgi:hypothetical protein
MIATKVKNSQKRLRTGSKVAVPSGRCLIIKHLRSETLAFESSALADSATPERESETTKPDPKLRRFR